MVLKVLRECNLCEYEWPVSEIIEASNVPKMSKVVFTHAEPEWHRVKDMDVNVYDNNKNGKSLGVITFYYGHNIYKRDQVRLWMCLLDYYSGYPVQKAKDWWDKLTNGEEPLPDNVDDFLTLENHILCPEEILIDENGEYPELIDVKYIDDEVPF